jgi:hypothetical protein
VPSQSSGGFLRTVASMVLGVLAVVLLPVALASYWAGTTLTDTNAFVDELSPVASQPKVQEALADGVVQGVLDAVDLQPAVEKALEPVIRNEATAIVASPEVQATWDESIRTAHAQFVGIMEGRTDAKVDADGRVSLVVRIPIPGVTTALQQAGVPNIAEALKPTIRIPLVSEQQLSTAQQVYRATDLWGSWGPAVVAALGLLAIVLAVRHVRAAVLLALAWAVVSVACAGALMTARGPALEGIEPDVARTVADAAYGLAARGLYTEIAVALAVSLGLLVVALVAGAMGRARRS